MYSPESLPLKRFYLYRFSIPIPSLELLDVTNTDQQLMPSGFYGLAVGIDLSDMGFSDGEEVSELWIQDAADDDAHVDPVFIGGLPPRGRPVSAVRE